jgi:osmoprotectant transport system ATP-binding protein
VLMRTGQIAQQGTMRDLINLPADPFVSQFIEAQQFEYGKFSQDVPS